MLVDGQPQAAGPDPRSGAQSGPQPEPALDPLAPWPRICVAGPLPPPAGGMAHQCAQLVAMLRAHGVPVQVVPSNAPYRPAWVARLPVLRAVCRLLPYLVALWRALGRSEVLHVLANSGWAWHLFAAPAIGLARLRRVPVIVHYHGGNAQAFLDRSPFLARWLLAGSALRVLPSAFLQRVFDGHGLPGEIIPNGLDLARFAPRAQAPGDAPLRLLVSRNLERLYGIDTAIRALPCIRAAYPGARLVVAGQGAERARLHALAEQLGQGGAVDFMGHVPNQALPALLAQACCLINPSRVDNMPVSVLEALAAGVPVVSTRVGGIPDLLQHGHNALLVPVDDPEALAAQVLRLLRDPALSQRLVRAGLAQAAQYGWARLRPLWLDAYRRAAEAGRA